MDLVSGTLAHEIMDNKEKKKLNWKEIIIREIRDMITIFLYLALFFCAFVTYRHLIMKELGDSYLEYGFALIKAFILAKVILLGKLTGFVKIFDDKPLIVPTLYKVVVFSLFMLILEVLEHGIGGLLHGEGLGGALNEMVMLGWNELLLRVLVMMSAFIPFFAFDEMGRLLGEGKLKEMFFHKRQPVS